MLIDCGHYVAGVRQGPTTLADVPALQGAHDSFVWLGLSAPSAAEFNKVREAFDLPALATELAIEPHPYATFTSLDESFNVTVRTLAYNPTLDRLHIGEESIFAGPGFVVSVRFGDSTTLAGVRHALESRPGALRLGAGAALHAILDRIVRDYIPVVQRLESQVLQVEREVFSTEHGRSLGRIFDLKRHLADDYGVVETLGEPFDRIIRLRAPWLPDQVIEQLTDLDHRVGRLTNKVRVLSDALTSTFEVNLTQFSVQQNEDMRRISAWAAILAVPTLVAGVYGMNFRTMPELDSRFGYPLALGVTLVVCLALYIRLRRSGWL